MITHKVASNTSFKGICVAKYQLPSGKKSQEVAIYQLEPKDIPCIEKLLDLSTQGKLFTKRSKIPGTPRKNWKLILWESLQKALDTIKMKENYSLKEEPSAKFIAVSKNKFCGVIVGNMPKVDKNCKKIIHCWTEKPNETELNFIATAPVPRYPKLRGVGTIITAELFNFVQKIENIKIMRVKSAQFAEDFYKKVGFIRDKPKNCVIPCETTETPRELAPMANAQKYLPEDSEVISMKITKNKAAKKFNEFATQFHRQEGNGESIDLATVINL